MPCQNVPLERQLADRLHSAASSASVSGGSGTRSAARAASVAPFVTLALCVLSMVLTRAFIVTSRKALVIPTPIIVSANNSLRKTGNGTVYLNGQNSYRGGTTISGGALVPINEDAIGGAGNQGKPLFRDICAFMPGDLAEMGGEFAHQMN